MQRRVMVGLVLALIAACASNEIDPGESPQSAAAAFLVLIDRGDYQTSWQEGSTFLRDNVDADQWAEHAGGFRRPLGEVISRDITSVEIQDSLEEMPAGQYAFVTFDSTLADERNATEMVGLVLDDDSVWRVIGYQTH